MIWGILWGMRLDMIESEMLSIPTTESNPD
jgi:hypothetical protein